MREHGENRRSRRLGDVDESRWTAAERDSYAGAEAFGADRYRNRSTDGYRQTASQRENSPTPEVSGSYSVESSSARYKMAGKRQRRKRRIVKGAAVAGALALVLLAGVLGVFSNINSALHEGLDSGLWSALTRVTAGDPFYVLLMGTDEDEARDGDEEFGGVFRTDTIILARVDPREQSLTLVSIPRDTQVDLGEYGIQKINAAHAFGGPTLAVQAVEDLTGVAISHYAEIDLDGFVGMVDQLGGIEVDVPMEINDEDAGGHVDAGLHTLTAWEALTLCRARNAYEEVVGQGDLYRAANQRLVLAAIVKKILASDPVTMTNAINACAQSVSTDMDVGEILDLAGKFRGFDVEQRLYSAVFPVESAYIDEIWWDLPDYDAWADMRERMQQGLSPVEEDEIDPTTGTVLATAGDSAASAVAAGEGEGSPAGNPVSGGHEGYVVVRNGSLHDGAAAQAGELLSQMGFEYDTDNADADDYPATLIVYNDASQDGEAWQIAEALGCGAPLLNDGTYAVNGDFLVIIGADWE